VPIDPSPVNGLLLDLFEQAVETAPERAAVITDTDTVTLAELNGQANAIAYRLLEIGCPTNSLIALFMAHGSEKVAAAISVTKAGAAYVSIDPIHKDQGVLDLFQHTRAAIVLTDRANEVRARRLADESVAVIEVSDLLARPVEQNPGVPLSADDLSRVAYTTGSTGTPKGAMHTHGDDHKQTLALMNLFKIGDGDRVAFMQYFRVTDLLGPMICGATIHPFDIRENGFRAMKSWLLRHAITCYGGIVTGFRQFLGALNPDEFFPAMRLVSVGGEAMYREDVERFDRAFPRTCAFIHSFSSSEMGRMAFFVPDRSALPPQGTVVPIGYPMPHMDVQLLDEEQMPVRQGMVGEIAVRGVALNLGYWDDPELSAKTWMPDKTMPGRRIFWAGDLAVMDAQGCLHSRGRTDQQVKFRGHRVLPGEIENMLTEHPAIKAAVVVLDRVNLGTERLVGYVVGETDSIPTTSELRTYLGHRLPDHMVPSVFMPVRGFELTATGKVDRRALPPPIIDIHDRVGDVVAPMNEVEAALKEIWEELLNEEGISVEDDFFLIGGDSVMALTMFLRLEQRLGRAIPFESLWLKGSTIRALAMTLTRQRPVTDWDRALPLQTTGEKPILFIAAMSEMPGHYCLPLIPHLGANQPVYGLPAKGIGGDALPDRRIEDMAAHCVEMMRQVQPQGPYRILGYSTAGPIAFEIARILHAQGIEVSKLALLDTSFPAAAGALANKALRQPLKAARIAGSLVRQSLGLGVADAPVTLNAARVGSLLRYRPNPYAGSAILITAAEREQNADLVRRWRRLIAGGLVTAEVPGDHRSMLQKPHVGELARILAGYLADWQRGNRIVGRDELSENRSAN